MGLPPEAFRHSYRLLDNETPLAYDCGQLCEKVCCRPKDTRLGIYLFPGEETMFSGQEEWLTWSRQDAQMYDFPPSWTGKVYFLRCSGSCSREQRPLQCRLFPLTAHLAADGSLGLIWETIRLPYRCPLLVEKPTLEPSFIAGVSQVWQTILADPLIFDLMEYDSRQRERYHPNSLLYVVKGIEVQVARNWQHA